MPSQKNTALSKTLFFFLFLIIIFFSFFLFFQKNFPSFFSPPDLNPTSSTADFIKKLTFSLDQASLSISGQLETYQSKKIVIFNIKDNIRVIFSLEKDPYFQVTSLQQILKTARMDTRQIEKVDLSLKKPYVTFKDN